MKKIAFFVALAVICCFLCSCDPDQYSIDREILDSVVSVELIEYENPDQEHFASWVPNQFNKLVTFDSANVTVIETLPAEKTQDFLEEFSQADILDGYYAYNSPKDICLRLNYENGNFLIAWANYEENSFSGYIGEYASDGTVLSFWGCFSSLIFYEELVNQFFTYNMT